METGTGTGTAGIPTSPFSLLLSFFPTPIPLSLSGSSHSIWKNKKQTGFGFYSCGLHKEGDSDRQDSSGFSSHLWKNSPDRKDGTYNDKDMLEKRHENEAGGQTFSSPMKRRRGLMCVSLRQGSGQGAGLACRLSASFPKQTKKACSAACKSKHYSNLFYSLLLMLLFVSFCIFLSSLSCTFSGDSGGIWV